MPWICFKIIQKRKKEGKGKKEMTQNWQNTGQLQHWLELLMGSTGENFHRKVFLKKSERISTDIPKQNK